MFAELIPIFLITLFVFVSFFLLMGIGYFVQKKPLRGSCGGVAAIMGNENCEFCGGDPNKCDKEIDATTANKASTLSKKA